MPQHTISLRPADPDGGRPAPYRLLAAVVDYIAATEWIFAKTMADNPHWYCVRQRAHASGIGKGHEALYRLCRDYSGTEWWGPRTWRWVDIDGFHYWIVEDGTVINRKPIPPALIADARGAREIALPVGGGALATLAATRGGRATYAQPTLPLFAA